MPNPITVSYDLDQGTFNQQAGQAPDTFQSTVIRFDPVTLTTTDNLLQIHLDFIEQENGAGQQLELRTLGTGGAQSLPTTFATKTGPGHDFGPGVILGGVNLSGFEGINIRAIPDEVTGPLEPGYATFRTGAIAGHGDPNSFEFFFQGASFGGAPDLLDDAFQPLRFGGITLELEYVGGEPSVTLDSLTFNVLSAEVDIRRSPAQFERLDDEISSIFVGDGNDNSHSGTDGYDVFFGQGGNDSFFGGAGPDVAYGGDGNDLLIMDSGRNVAFGGNGDDNIQAIGIGGSQLSGGNDNDNLNGSFDNDVLDGGNGQDRLFGSYGNDVLTGGGDIDTYEFRGDIRIAFRGIGDDLINGFENGVDRIEIETFQTGVASFADIAPNIVDGAQGAVLTIGDEGTITFLGIPATSLDATDFFFV
jgi:hypothetical protein